MSDEEQPQACTTCHQVHGMFGYHPMHLPTYEGGNQNAIPPRQRPAVRRSPPPPAPVGPAVDGGLRLALIRAGVLTLADLEAADRELAVLAGKILDDLKNPKVT